MVPKCVAITRSSDEGVHKRRINEIVYSKCRIIANIDFILVKYFDMSLKFLIGLQVSYDLKIAKDVHVLDKISTYKELHLNV